MRARPRTTSISPRSSHLAEHDACALDVWGCMRKCCVSHMCSIVCMCVRLWLPLTLVCCDRSRFRARGSREARPGRVCAARLGAYGQLCFGCAGLLRCHASSLPRRRFFVRFALPTHTVDPPTTSFPSSTTVSHAPPFALADSPLPLSSTALPNPPNMIFTHLTPASSSLPPLQPHPYNELTPALRASQATTRQDFGAASSLMSQNDRVVALLLPLVVNSC